MEMVFIGVALVLVACTWLIYRVAVATRERER
jgi:hypothetical protein